MMSATVGFFVLLGVVAWHTALVAAHGSGTSFERDVAGVRVDIGYAPEELVAGGSALFDFAISDPTSGEEVPYTDIWVRLHQNRDSFFASGLAKASIGATTMLFQFPEAGTYQLSVRFQDAGETVAETTFEVPVVSGADTESRASNLWTYAALLFFGAGAGGLIGWLFQRILRTTSTTH